MPNTPQPSRKKPSSQALRRAVASSTAVETGASVAQLEQQLQTQAKATPRFPQVKLAR